MLNKRKITLLTDLNMHLTSMSTVRSEMWSRHLCFMMTKSWSTCKHYDNTLCLNHLNQSCSLKANKTCSDMSSSQPGRLTRALLSRPTAAPAFEGRTDSLICLC